MNKILRSLDPDNYQRLTPFFRKTPLKARQVLHQPGIPIADVYFVTEGLISVVARTDATSYCEVRSIGREGFVGLPLLLGAQNFPHRRIVQVGGSALCMSADDFCRLKSELPAFRDALMRYVQAVLTQTAQSGACNSRHSIQERLARWLLLAHDRMDGDLIPLTHALLSNLFGVRRASITLALRTLEEREAISQLRGCITIVDRDRLQSLSCDCYRIIAGAYYGLNRTVDSSPLLLPTNPN